jgi:hypothetical protein
MPPSGERSRPAAPGRGQFLSSAWPASTLLANGREDSCPTPDIGSRDDGRIKTADPFFGENKKRIANAASSNNYLKLLAVPTGLEPVTFGLGNRCSIRLSYGTIGGFQ